jgi:hypothetical protein
MSKCGFCGIPGHKIRQCNSEAAAELLAEYRGITTEVALDDFLRRQFCASLSIVMISYGARSTSISRMEKIQYIRFRWAHALAVAVAAPVHALPLVDPDHDLALDVAPHVPASVAAAPMSRRMFLQLTVDSIFEQACINFGGQNEMILAADLYPLFSFIGESIVLVTGDSYSALEYVSKRIFQKFQMPRNTHSRGFYNSCMVQAFQRASQERLNEVIEFSRLNPEVEPIYVPHKPQFTKIKLCSDQAKKSDEYICEICGDEHTQETLPTLGCDHTMCYECISGQIKARSKSRIKCPFCREEVVQISVKDSTILKQISALVASENLV